MVLRTSLLLLALGASGMVLAGQSPTNAVQGPNPNGTSPMPPATAPTPPSATLQPSLDVLKQALAGISTDKWKASPAIRTEADGNLRSVQRDVESTLPPLVAAADAAPDSVAKAIPVFRNIDALYDVMLRLDTAGRLAAPRDQMSALDQALASVSDARHSLGDQLQTSAEAQDARVMHLQAALKAVPPPPPPAPAPVACTPPPPVKKRRVTKPATKPATSTSSNSQTTPTPTSH
jgi:hypothetical protein